MPKAKVNGININYRVQGQGEPLVLIMGAFGDQFGWMFQTGAFRKYYRVITFDNRGVGKTDKPGGAYSTKIMADDTIGLMDHLGIKKAHILGISMGGAIAQVIAINYPKRINKLILGCTWAGGDESGHHPQEFLKALGIGESHTNDDSRSMTMREIAGLAMSSTFNSKLCRIILPLLMKIQFRLMPTTGLLGHMEVDIGHNTADNLQTINVPTLVITGTKDRLIKPTSSEVIAKLIPNAKLVKVEGGSHGFFIEMRGRFNREVLDFLRDK